MAECRQGKGWSLGLGQDLAAQLTPQALGQAKGPGAANAVGQLIIDHVRINAIGGGIFGFGGSQQRFANILQNLPQQNRLELARDFSHLVVVRELGVSRQRFQRQLGRVDIGMGAVNFHVIA